MRLKTKFTKLQFKIIFFLLFLTLIADIDFTFAKSKNILSENKEENINEYNEDYDEYYNIDNKNTEKISDPFEKLNRKMFDFNIYLLNNVGEPVTNGFKFVFPDFFRERFANFGDRFLDPIVLLNSILEFDFVNSAKTIATFVTNMTIGIFGLFNPAKYFGFYREKRTFGDTMYFYGIGNGFYIMLPFLGPTTTREGIGMAADFFANPLSWNILKIHKNKSLTPDRLKIPQYIGKYESELETAINLNNQFLKKSFDPYIFLRESYLQNLIYKQKRRGK